jgi:hypothetical protein
VVDAECLVEVRGGLAGVAVVEMSSAESFQGASFLERRADVPRDGEGLGVPLAGPAGG